MHPKPHQMFLSMWTKRMDLNSQGLKSEHVIGPNVMDLCSDTPPLLGYRWLIADWL